MFQISDSCNLMTGYWFRIRILLTKIQPLYCQQLKRPTFINVNKIEKVKKKNLKCDQHTKTMGSLFHFWQTLTNPMQDKNICCDSTVSMKTTYSTNKIIWWKLKLKRNGYKNMDGFLFHQMLIFISNTITETEMIHRHFD